MKVIQRLSVLAVIFIQIFVFIYCQDTTTISGEISTFGSLLTNNFTNDDNNTALMAGDTPEDLVYLEDSNHPVINYYPVESFCHFDGDDEELICGYTKYGRRRPLGLALSTLSEASDSAEFYKLIIRDLEKKTLKKGSILPLQDVSEVIELILQNTSTISIEEGALDRFLKLEKLVITRNFLTSIDPKMFSSNVMERITELNFHGNNLTSISPEVLLNFSKLSTLNLAFNPLNMSNVVFTASLDKLKILNLGYCNITDLPADIFVNLTRLQDLILEGNPLTSIPSAISKLPSLYYLDMDKTAITVLTQNDAVTNQNLEKMTFTRMPNLTEIGPRAFVEFPRLQSLTFTYSQHLHTINESAFGYPEKTPKIETLNLEHCEVAFLPQNLLDWHSVEKFYYRHNPLWCSCENAWLIDDLRSNNSHFKPMFKNIMVSQLRCHGPGKFTARYIKSLNASYCTKEPESKVSLTPTVRTVTSATNMADPDSLSHMLHGFLSVVIVIAGILLAGTIGYVAWGKWRERRQHQSVPNVRMQMVVDNVNYDY